MAAWRAYVLAVVLAGTAGAGIVHGQDSERQDGLERLDVLEPEHGPLGEFTITGDYHLRLARLLLGEREYRRCQMVFLPPFDVESAVYVVRDEAGEDVRVVTKELDEQLRYVLQADESELEGVTLADVRVSTWTAPLSTEVARILEDVWRSMLTKVRHAAPNEKVLTIDGTSYHAASFVEGAGYYAGQTVSPPPNSGLGRFVALAEALRDYPKSHEQMRFESSKRLRQLALDLDEELRRNGNETSTR